MKPGGLYESVATPASACPYCGYRVEMAAGVTAPFPKPGDVTVCFDCAGLSVFDPDMQLVAATDEDLGTGTSALEVARVQLAVREMHRVCGRPSGRPL